MRKDQQLGLDELMIVNPSSSGTEARFLGEEEAPQGLGQFFLGEDGTLYQVQGLGLNGAVEGPAAENVGEKEAHELGRYLLGADGTLYEVVS